MRDARRAFGGARNFQWRQRDLVVTETDGAQTGAQIKFSLARRSSPPSGRLSESLATRASILRSVAAAARRSSGTASPSAFASRDALRLLAQAVARGSVRKTRSRLSSAFAFRRLTRADFGSRTSLARSGWPRALKAFRREFGCRRRPCAGAALCPHARRAAHGTIAERGGARSAWRLRRPAHMIHDFREFPAAALGAVAAGTARRRRIRRLSNGVTFPQYRRPPRA